MLLRSRRCGRTSVTSIMLHKRWTLLGTDMRVMDITWTLHLKLTRTDKTFSSTSAILDRSLRRQEARRHQVMCARLPNYTELYF